MNVHPSEFLPVTPGQGGLILTPCPGSKGIDRATALAQLHAAGAEAVITLMPASEMAENAVSDLPEQCARLGLRWFHLPIADDHAPGDDFTHAWQAQRQSIHALLDAGKRIAVHCKGGSGRTGLVAAQVLLERDWTAAAACAAVKALRPNALSLAVHQQYLASLIPHTA